jgi:Zn-dependent M16 (insulinase) family peptidase
MSDIFFMAAVDGIDNFENVDLGQKQFSLVASQGNKIDEVTGNIKFKLICATDPSSKTTARILADFSANSLHNSISSDFHIIEDSRLDTHLKFS